jgi:acetate kinase
MLVRGGNLDMANLSQIVEQLKTEEERLKRELKTVSGVLAAFGGRLEKRTVVRKLSAAGRKRIAAAQRARWAKIRGEKQSIVAMPKRRTMSAAARKKIAAAQRARWAKFRAKNKVA